MSNEPKIFLSQKPPAQRWVFMALLIVAIAGGGMAWLRPTVSGDILELPASSGIQPKRTITNTAPVPVLPSVSPALVLTRPDRSALDGHLLLYLPFTSSLEDQSGRRLRLESSGSVEVHDGAAHFPGDSFLTLPHINLYNRPFAFSLWIKPEGTISGYGLLEQVDGGPGKHLHILLRDPDKPYMGFYLNDLRAPQSLIPAAGWVHLVFQFTGSHQQIWIGGELSIERLAEPYAGGVGETRIGKAPMWNNLPTQCFKGAMRDLRLYDLALTPAQIRSLAGLEANDPPPGGNPPKDTF